MKAKRESEEGERAWGVGDLALARAVSACASERVSEWASVVEGVRVVHGALVARGEAEEGAHEEVAAVLPQNDVLCALHSPLPAARKNLRE